MGSICAASRGGLGSAGQRAHLGAGFFRDVLRLSQYPALLPGGVRTALWRCADHTGPRAVRQPIRNFPGRKLFPVPFNANAPFTPFGTFISQNPNTKATTVVNWNLGIQKQLGKDWLVSATYMGLETEHLWVTYQINPGQFLGLGACTLPNSPRVWNPCSAA